MQTEKKKKHQETKNNFSSDEKINHKHSCATTAIKC